MIKNNLKRKRLSVKVLLISIVLAIVTVSIAHYPVDDGKETQEVAGEKSFSLIPPPFVKTAMASEVMGGSAFPEDEAGISAYVNTSQEIDLEKLKTIFTDVEEVGENYIVGITPISDLGGDINVTVYADTGGWIVAYFKKDEHASNVMRWETYVHSPITSTTLKEAITKAADAADILWAVKDIKYYDFEFTEADGMTIFTRNGDWGTSITQVEIPATYRLYEASYYYYSSSSSGTLKVDGITTCSGYGRNIDSYKGAITTGKLHKIEINYGSAATVLIYKRGQ